MGRSKNKPNNLNQAGVQGLKEQLERAWPQTSVKKAGFIKDSDALGLSSDPKFKEQFVSAAIEVRGDDAHVRLYRKPDEQDSHDYDVDEIRHANQSTVTRPAKSDIDRHHLTGTIPDDLMARNNLIVESVPDGKGGLTPNVQPDGTVMAYINFMDALPFDESTPGEQTWFCRSCQKRYTIRHAPTIDPMALSHVMRQQHMTKSPECRGEIEILIRPAISPTELETILAYEPA